MAIVLTVKRIYIYIYYIYMYIHIGEFIVISSVISN